MRKTFVALIAMFALTFTAVTLASVSPTKQKTDTVAHVSVEKTVAMNRATQIIPSTEARASAVCDVIRLNHAPPSSGAQSVKPDKRIDYGNRKMTNSRGYRQAQRVLNL